MDLHVCITVQSWLEIHSVSILLSWLAPRRPLKRYKTSLGFLLCQIRIIVFEIRIEASIQPSHFDHYAHAYSTIPTQDNRGIV